MLYSSQLFSISDALWNMIAPLLPSSPKKKRGRPSMDDRKAMTAILFIFYTGCQWKALPPYLGAKSTVHDRFQYWNSMGIFEKLWANSLLYYDHNFQIRWDWQALDGCHIVAPLGGDLVGPSYKHRGKNGSNRSILVDKNGIPLSIVLAPANRNDFLLTELNFESFVIPRPDPSVFPQNLSLDKGYDYPQIDCTLHTWQYIGHIRRKNEPELPPENRVYEPKRWVVERTHSWLNHFRCIFIRWTRKSFNYLCALQLACAIITLRASKVISKIF